MNVSKNNYPPYILLLLSNLCLYKMSFFRFSTSTSTSVIAKAYSSCDFKTPANSSGILIVWSLAVILIRQPSKVMISKEDSYS